MKVSGKLHAPAAFSLGKCLNSLNAMLDATQSRSEYFGKHRRSLPMRGFKSRIVQVVASFCSVYAVMDFAHTILKN